MICLSGCAPPAGNNKSNNAITPTSSIGKTETNIDETALTNSAITRDADVNDIILLELAGDVNQDAVLVTLPVPELTEGIPGKGPLTVG